MDGKFRFGTSLKRCPFLGLVTRLEETIGFARGRVSPKRICAPSKVECEPRQDKYDLTGPLYKDLSFRPLISTFFSVISLLYCSVHFPFVSAEARSAFRKERLRIEHRYPRSPAKRTVQGLRVRGERFPRLVVRPNLSRRKETHGSQNGFCVLLSRFSGIRMRFPLRVCPRDWFRAAFAGPYHAEN